jgi:hypothetical protein
MTEMVGQGTLGAGCAWCGLPAVCDVQVQPARYRSVSRLDPMTGRRTAHQRLVQAPIRVPVCDEHRDIATGQPPAPGIPRERKTRERVDQLDLFAPSSAGATGTAAGGAIAGETGRR